MAKPSKKQMRARRHQRLRNRVAGSAVIPRMSVCCTQKHIYIQFIDDVAGRTLASASTLDAELKGKDDDAKADMTSAVKVAEVAAKRAKEANITKAVFDRGGFKFHGRVKAIADTARKAGLEL